MTYDQYGQLLSKVAPDFAASYTYRHDGMLLKETNGLHTLEYTYDSYDRPTYVLETISNKNFATSYTYSGVQLAKTTYPSLKYEVSYEYNSLGFTKKVTGRDSLGHIAAKEISRTAPKAAGSTHQYTFSNKLTDKRKYDRYGQQSRFELLKPRIVPTDSLVGTITVPTDPPPTEDRVLYVETYEYNTAKGLLMQRAGGSHTESFAYDNYDRLTGFGSKTVNYTNNGNIIKKDGAGHFSYTSSRPYAVANVYSPDTTAFSSTMQDIAYKSFLRPSSIIEGEYRAYFDYGTDYDRCRMEVRQWRDSLQRDELLFIRYYFAGGKFEATDYSETYSTNPLILQPESGVGEVEITPKVKGLFEIDTAGMNIPPGIFIPVDSVITIDFPRPDEPVYSRYDDIVLYIDGSPYKATMAYAPARQNKHYYIHRDRQGSVRALSDTAGNVVAKYFYDPWGRQTDALGNPYPKYREPLLLLGRGYTGHEHLPWFGLINMNARLYDPVLGRFLSPDPFVQAPDLFQNFNRYSYCMNNPLMYVDENGEFWHIIIGAIIGGVINVVTNWDKIDNFWQGLGYFGVGAAVGAGSAALGGWVAGATQSAGIITGAAVGAGTGAVTGAASSVTLNGLNNVIGGQNFWDDWQQSAISGAIGGGISGGIAGGMKGYELAKEGGKNMWWGGDVKHGRTQWSFFTAEKPYETISWDINRVGSSSLNDCVPTSFAEANDFLGGNTTYNEYKTITNYQENVGVATNRAGYQTLVSDNFHSSNLNGAALADPAVARQIQNSGGLVHTNMPHSGIRHADNLRSIKYYHSGKVVMNFRIGSYRLSSVDNNWWFYVLR